MNSLSSKLSRYSIAVALALLGFSQAGFANPTANNGLMVVGLNYDLTMSKSSDYTQSEAVYGSHNGSWVLSCKNDACTSEWASTGLETTAYGKTVKYLLVNFPSIDTDPYLVSGSTVKKTAQTESCQGSTWKTSKFMPTLFNYVEPYEKYSSYLGGYYSTCVGGAQITKAFAQNGVTPIPYISGDGSAIDEIEAAVNGGANVQHIANLIAESIINDPSAGGVAFDLEPAIKSDQANKDFYGTIEKDFQAAGKGNYPIMVYDGSWKSLQSIKNIIAMGAMYDQGIEGADHWFQGIPVNEYVKSVQQAYNGFVSGDASSMNRMVVLPAAGSDTVWTSLKVYNYSKGDDPIPSSRMLKNLIGVSSYDPYEQPFKGSYSTTNLDADPDSNPNLGQGLLTPTKENCSGALNCFVYQTPYSVGNSSARIKQVNYIKPAVDAIEQVDKSKGKQLFGYMLYNMKPDNFYSLNCANVVHMNYRCLAEEPADISKSILNLEEWTQ